MTEYAAQEDAPEPVADAEQVGDESVEEPLDEAAEAAGEQNAEDRAAREEELLAEEPDPGVGLPRNEDGGIQTGHPAVDEVLRSLGALDGAPVDEHVAVFEQAHEQLRRTLAGAGDDQA
jgi:hypothetical protein